MNRYDLMFSRLSESNEGAFIPFVVLGDPNIELSVRIIQTLIESGADALELGLAFSDPVADGPTIQKADMRVLANGTNFAQILQLLSQVREKNPQIPIGILTYANLVVHDGMANFYIALQRSGVDSLLIADVPTLEIEPFLEMGKKHEIAQVMIVPPNIDDRSLKLIAQKSAGYVYVVTRSGVTGSDETLGLTSNTVFSKLRDLGAAPGVYGFGISTPAHVKIAIAAGAKGAISGSAITAIIEQNLKNESKMLREIGEFAQEMKKATF